MSCASFIATGIKSGKILGFSPKVVINIVVYPKVCEKFREKPHSLIRFCGNIMENLELINLVGITQMLVKQTQLSRSVWQCRCNNCPNYHFRTKHLDWTVIVQWSHCIWSLGRGLLYPNTCRLQSIIPHISFKTD